LEKKTQGPYFLMTTKFFEVKGAYKKPWNIHVSMASTRSPGGNTTGIIGLGVILMLVLLVGGCAQPASAPTGTQITPATETPTGQASVTGSELPGITPSAPAEGGKKMVTFTNADDGKTGDITQNTRFAVELAENPTTGFMWNATLSPGLELQSTDFRQSPEASGMTGAGGTRTWIIIAHDLGEQKFSATYKRSWENVTGNETAYHVSIRVASA
jgi:predicted secreted protein